MRLSKQFIGIAATVAFASGLVTTGTAFATPSGTQIEYNGHSVSPSVGGLRAYAIAFAWSEVFALMGL